MFNSIFKKGEKEKERSKTQSQAQGHIHGYEDRQVLPANFAQTVMELEMQLEFVETYSMELVQQLNDMYRVSRSPSRSQSSTT
jgi:hypothetical protein